MATIQREISIASPPERVWDAVRDVGALHTRLVPGLVVDTQLEDDNASRVVTFANGLEIRETIITIDDRSRRLAYAATGGRTKHHNASVQVFADDSGGSRLVWITDSLPDEVGTVIHGLVEQGSQIMKRTLERAGQ